MVRLSKADGAWQVVCEQSDGLGGSAPGALASRAERDRTPTAAGQFGRLWERVAFWDTPSTEDPHGVDGSQAVLEGARAVIM